MPPPGIHTLPRSLSSNRTTSSSSHMRLPPLSQLPIHLSRLAHRALSLFVSLSLKVKAIIVTVALVYLALVIIVLRIGTHGILEYLSGFALFFSHSSIGPALLLLIIVILSFPPLIGYGTSITICGLSFGSPQSGEGHGLLLAWSIAAGGCLMGSTATFLAGRMGLARYGDRVAWVREVREGKEWRAMEKAVERKGWKMAILIRLCPFPFVYSNLFFASLRPSSMSLPLFLIATLCTTPKLLLHVFVGAKAFEAIQSGKDGRAAKSSWLSIGSMIGASLLGAATSWYIYRETKKVLDSFLDEDEEEVRRFDAEGNGRRGEGSRGERHSVHAAAEGSWGWLDEEREAHQKRSPSSLTGNGRHHSGAATPATTGDLEVDSQRLEREADGYASADYDEARRSLLGRDHRSSSRRG